MKIAFVHPRAPTDEGTGAAHSATLIVDLLLENGCDVTVYCCSRSSPEIFDRYDCRRLELGGFPGHSAMALNERLRERSDELDGFDLIHSYLPKSLPAMNVLSRETSAATVLTLNAYGSVCPKNDLRYRDRETCREHGLARCATCCLTTAGGHQSHGATYRGLSRLGNLYVIRKTWGERPAVDGFHVLSCHVRDIHVEFGYPSDRIQSIPNILEDRFLVEHESDGSEPYRLLYVGSLQEHKGIFLLPKIMRLLKERSGRRFTLTVVGEGAGGERLSAEFERHGVNERVELRGTVPHRELPSVYAAHDIFLYPGVWDEPFGRVLLESLAAGTPVVGSDVGAVAEIVGEGGIVVEPSAESLADGVLELVESSRLTACAEAARDEVSAYTPGALAPSFLRLYRQSLERSGGLDSAGPDRRRSR